MLHEGYGLHGQDHMINMRRWPKKVMTSGPQVTTRKSAQMVFIG